MSKLLLFDVDGTLAESSQMINEKMREMLILKKEQGYHIGIVGGGKIGKVLTQLNGVAMNYYFTECGCVHHVLKDGNTMSNCISLVNQLSLKYTKNLRDHNLYPHINKLVKQCLHFLSKVDYTISGHFVDLREGIIYISLIGMTATLGNLKTAYDLFSNEDEIAVDYLVMGPGLTSKFESQAKANHLIALAGQRKDCMAVVSPHRADVVDVTNTDTQTNNVIEFFSPLASSSYAVFDSGYKYTYDRFNDKFRYIPCNADVAGLMVRTSINAFPWFSPAGQQRGILNNAIKLAYNPSKAQRDQLYPLRVNSIVNQPGTGVLLFGDKTALSYASAFDRINVRRLFLTVEQALERAAEAQLFELNDQITRANFVNIVEPYLRDIQAKRGLYGFLVICDETNNTPDVIDNNEFRADIFLKPAKAINYVTLTFVATRTGISFEEVAGRV